MSHRKVSSRQEHQDGVFSGTAGVDPPAAQDLEIICRYLFSCGVVVFWKGYCCRGQPQEGGAGCVIATHAKLIYSESDTSSVESVILFKTAKVPPSTAPLYANTVFL